MSFALSGVRRTAAASAVLLLMVGALGACGDDEPGSPGTGDPGTSDSGVITITFDGDTVTPNGERVEVETGQEITLDVTADAPGEIHVHSNPEQEFEYDEGHTELTLTIDEPGVVDVESHDLEVVIVQLEVS